MRRRFFLTALCAGFMTAGALNSRGQDRAPAVEFSFDGSKLWQHAVGGPYHNHGWGLGITGNINRFLGVEMHTSKFQDISPWPPAYGDYFRFLAGPHYEYNGISRVSPFAHVLMGVTHGRQSCFSLTPPPDCNFGNWERGGNAFTAAVGAGVDFEVFRFFWIRPIQADYVRVSFPNARENNLQLSFGLIFRFGSVGKTGKH